jgi:rRNA pseudouridine-1189 N-methylase Emg1 (Nep1/Mra1 family)
MLYIVKESLNNSKKYKVLKKKWLKNNNVRVKLKHMYGKAAELNNENSNKMYLHAELNVLTSVINREKERIFIAVLKNAVIYVNCILNMYKKSKNITLPFWSHMRSYILNGNFQIPSRKNSYHMFTLNLFRSY